MRIELLGLCFTDAAGIEVAHDPWVSLLSFGIAVIASFTAFGLAERYHFARGRLVWLWLAGCGLAMGGGVWAMHFVAMMAFQIGAPVSYDPIVTGLSLAVAVVAATASISISSRHSFGWLRLAGSSLVMGLGIGVMHYTGMAAMEFAGTIAYRPGLFGLSVIVAVAAMTVATWISFHPASGYWRLVVALIGATGTVVTHYVGMTATVITLEPLALQEVADGHGTLVVIVSTVTLAVLVMGLVSVAADRWVSRAARREAAALKRANEMLTEAVAKANAANQAKTDFLAIVAHEFRTPLNGIIGFSSLLMDYAKLEPEPQQWCRFLQTAGNTLSDLVNDVIEYARLERDALELDAESFDVHGLLESCIAMARFQAAEKGLSLSVEFALDLPLQLRGDARRIRQILTNLLTNAMKYTDHGGITVLVASAPDARLVVKVSDTGRGIAEPDQAAVFDRFRTGTGSGSRRQGGLGLGLAIARGLARRMGGDIALVSRLGVGSTFTVRLPLDDIANRQQARDNLRILVVDDVQANRQIIRACLKLLGHDVVEAPSGEDAVLLAASSAFDLVLMDIQMPGINGWEAARRIRSLGGKAGAVPIIAVTADASVGQDGEDWGCHMIGYIPKPIDTRNFGAEVTRILASGQLSAPPGPGGAVVAA